VLRPCDANETVDAWCQALKTNNRPVAMLFSRQKLPILPKSQTGGQLSLGGYIISDCEGTPDVILLASGAEVHQALDAQKMLQERGTAARVVNMASWELFEEQTDEYKERILPREVKARVAVEAGISMGWDRYVGQTGTVIGMGGFGASAPGGEVLSRFGFTAENVVEKALALIQK
jgi:transketolase